MKQFISGNEAAFKGALAAGAKAMYGYPITPSTEILQYWSEASEKDDNLIFIQTEDETAAGFAVNGSVLMGLKTFTATAGPGTVLMQDGLSMAENLRLPTVTIVMQRGGPSTGTVNYSQQELMLACFGGNGEGLRIVYSAGSPQEMYDYVIKAFNSAWRYRFPTIVLGDGFIGKQKYPISMPHPITPISSKNLLKGQNLRNCYSNEVEFNQYLSRNISEFEQISKNVAEYEYIGSPTNKSLIIAHGSVFYAVKAAIAEIDPKFKTYSIFRPITLRPLAEDKLKSVTSKIKHLYFFESAHGQLYRLIADKLQINSQITVHKDFQPALSFTKSEIIKYLKG